MIIGRSLEKIVDWAGELLAFATISLILVMYINGKYNFIPADMTKTLALVREIAILSVVALKAIEFALKRNIFFFLISAAIIIVTFVFLFQEGAIPNWHVSELFSFI